MLAFTAPFLFNPVTFCYFVFYDIIKINWNITLAASLSDRPQVSIKVDHKVNSHLKINENVSKIGQGSARFPNVVMP